MNSNTLLWFRNDLRLGDNPALNFAAQAQRGVIPVFIHSPKEEAAWTPGGASNWWLAQSLRSLETALGKKNSRLTVLKGPTEATLKSLIQEFEVKTVVWNRRYEPAIIARDTKIKLSLEGLGVEVKSFNGQLLREPWELKTGSGGPYQVYTPFWNALLKLPDPAEPLPIPRSWKSPESWPKSLKIEDLSLEPQIPWDKTMAETWTPGEEASQRALKKFIKGIILDYDNTRNLPASTGTSRLSPHLHFGEISPRQIWHAVISQFPDGVDRSKPGVLQFLKEIVWREFAYHLLFHFPHTDRKPLREKFEAFPWSHNAKHLSDWQKGQTGYPIVDAGMRELWATGWMHNRVRMIVASFLVKHLRLSWQEGAEWFWDTLVDADLASNTLGWQWSAGCGADAAPYFRIFNPILQGEKFDPDGVYVKKWIPELARMEKKYIHQPWTAPHPPTGYPSPIVDHGESRDGALKAYATLAVVKSPTTAKATRPRPKR